MFLIWLSSVLSIKKEYCIYKSKKELCSGIEHTDIYPYSELKNQLQIQDDKNISVMLTFVEDMPGRTPISFDGLKSRLVDIFLFGYHSNINIYIDISNATVTNLVASNITFCNVNHVFSLNRSATFQNCKFTGTTSESKLVAKSIISDYDSLIQFPDYSTEKLRITLKLNQLTEDGFLRLPKNEQTYIRINLTDNNSELNLLGDDFYISSPNEKYVAHFICQCKIIKRVGIFCNTANSNFTLYCLARGPHYYDNRFYITTAPNQHVYIPKSLWPEDIDPIVDISHPRGDTFIHIAQYRAPIKISSNGHKLTIIAEDKICGLLGSLHTTKEYLTLTSSNESEYRTFVVESFAPNGNVSVTNEVKTLEFFMCDLSTSEGSELYFLGDGKYCLRSFPLEIVHLTFSNLRLRNFKETPISCTLDKALRIDVLNHITLHKLEGSIIPEFVNDDFSIDEIAKRIGTEYPLVCAADLDCDALPMSFTSSVHQRGFSKGNSVLEKQCKQRGKLTCLEAKMTKNIINVGYQFCVNPDRLEYVCADDHIELNSYEDFEGWQTYADHDITALEFYIYGEMKDNDGNIAFYNFSKFDIEGASIIFMNRATKQSNIKIDHKIFHSGAASISLTGLMVSTQEGWNGTVDTSLYLKETKFVDTPQMLFYKKNELNTDMDSYAELGVVYPYGLKISDVLYRTASIRNDSIVLSANGGNQKTINIKDGAPKLYLQLEGDFEVNANSSSAKEMVPIEFDSFGSFTIDLKGNFPTGYHGIELDQFTGTVNSRSEYIPIKTVPGGSRMNDYKIVSSKPSMIIGTNMSLDEKISFSLGTGKDRKISISEAIIGSNTDITYPDNATLSIKRLKVEGKVPKVLKNIHIEDWIEIDNASTIIIDDISFENNATIKVNFRPETMPFAMLNRNKNDKTAIKFEARMKSAESDAAIGEVASRFRGRYLELICGRNLQCNDWNMSVNSKTDDLPFELRCLTFKETQCVVLEKPGSSKPEQGSKWIPYAIGGGCGAVLLIIITVVVVVVIKKRNKNMNSAISAPLVNSIALT